MNTMYWLHGAEPRHYCKFCKKSLQFKFVIAYWANIGLASTRAARAALAGHVGPFAAGRRTGLAHWGRSTSLPPPRSLFPSLPLSLSVSHSPSPLPSAAAHSLCLPPPLHPSLALGCLAPPVLRRPRSLEPAVLAPSPPNCAGLTIYNSNYERILLPPLHDSQ